jgi:hypothetical protein
MCMAADSLQFATRPLQEKAVEPPGPIRLIEDVLATKGRIHTHKDSRGLGSAFLE